MSGVGPIMGGFHETIRVARVRGKTLYSSNWEDQYTHWLGERVREKAEELRPKLGSGADELISADIHSLDVMAAFQAGWERAMAEAKRWGQR